MGEQRQGGRGASWRELDATVPPDHILRRIDRLLDMGNLRDALAPHYSGTGRPSIAPELLIRMALIGRLFAIHRRLLEPIGNIPPAEAEDQYYAAADNIDMAA